MFEKLTEPRPAWHALLAAVIKNYVILFGSQKPTSTGEQLKESILAILLKDVTVAADDPPRDRILPASYALTDEERHRRLRNASSVRTIMIAHGLDWGDPRVALEVLTTAEDLLDAELYWRYVKSPGLLTCSSLKDRPMSKD